MKKGFIIFAVVVIILLYVMSKINTARQLEFSLGIPRNISLKSGALTFDLPLNARNVSQGSIRLKGADIDVLSGNQSLGKAIIQEPVTIAPASVTVITTKVSVSYVDLLVAVTRVIQLFKTGKINLTLDGLVYAEGFQYPLKQSFDLDTKTLV